MVSSHSALRFCSTVPIVAETSHSNLFPSATNKAAMSRTPVYFLSNGGPYVMYDDAHPVYARLAQLGPESTIEFKPKAIVVFCAHWQTSGKSTIGVNTIRLTNLIYDFYGFPYATTKRSTQMSAVSALPAK